MPAGGVVDGEKFFAAGNDEIAAAARDRAFGRAVAVPYGALGAPHAE